MIIKRLIVFAFLIFATLSADGTSINWKQVKKLPVQEEGRVKPLDTIARNTLLFLHGSQTIYYKNRKLQPIEWLLDTTMNPKQANKYPVFRIDHPEVLGLIHKNLSDGKYYRYQDLKNHIDEISRLGMLASKLPENSQDSYQNAILKLAHQINIYERLNNTFFLTQSENPLPEISSIDSNLTPKEMHNLLNEFTMQASVAYFQNLFPIDEFDSDKWYNMGEGRLFSIHRSTSHPGLYPYIAMIQAYQQTDTKIFNENLEQYQDLISISNPKIASLMTLETYFNQIQPFYLAIIFYLFAFILTIISWIFWPKVLYKIAFTILITGFFIHSFGIITRMIIEGRPPVTNLYSSAVFVGWGSVLIALILEKLYKNGIGIAVSSIIGCLTLIIAHHLAEKGDTMEMMRAVLNSNFWLATHVVTITIGYSACFLAGFIGCLYVLKRILSKDFNKNQESDFGKMVFGIICFALLFSFIGTVLGGIWADQSWGRFWGWDPKENGALLIILWNAAVLHAVHFRLITTQTLMILAIFGNIVTSFSWFGVNMLGVGLHSYGATDQAYLMLAIFFASQILFMGLGCFTRHCDN